MVSMGGFSTNSNSVSDLSWLYNNSNSSSSSNSNVNYTDLLNTQMSNQKELMAAAFGYRSQESTQDFQQNSYLSLQDYNQKANMSSQEFGQTSKLSAQDYDQNSKLSAQATSQDMQKASQQQSFRETNDKNAFNYSGQLQAQGSRERMDEETHSTGQRIRISDNDRAAAARLWNSNRNGY